MADGNSGHERGDGTAQAALARVPTLFFGVGAQKCGTTWLHRYLSRHPEVKVPGVAKELHYWTTVRPPHSPWPRRGMAKERTRNRLKRAGLRLLRGAKGRATAQEWALWERAIVDTPRDVPDHEAYCATLMAGYAGERAVGEITPYYAVLEPDAFREMAALSPGSRFLFLMRDPVERALSGIRMHLSRKLGQTVAAADLDAGIDRALDGDPDEVILRTRYDHTLAALDAAVGRERIGVFFYESFFDQAEIDRLTGFLGVAPHPAETSERVHVGAGREVEPSAAARQRLAAALAPTYAFVHARHSDRVPAAWAAP